MGLLQLKYFKELAEQEHLTRTAKTLLVSAPSLSASIARLESQIGYKLFDRDGRKMRLNECGRIYLKYVNEVFAALENARLEMKDCVQSTENMITLGITSPIIWHEALQCFCANNPQIKVSHSLLKLDQLENSTTCAQFDFIITATSDLPGDDWNMSILLPDDRPVIAVYPSHPLAKLSEIRFIELKNENFIAVSKGFSMRKYFDDLCIKAGFVPKIILECDYMFRAKMLALQYGISLTTESGYKTGTLENTIAVKISDPAIRRTQAIMWNKSHYLSKSAHVFHDFMVNYYRNQNHL